MLRTKININTIEYRGNEKLVSTANLVIDRIEEENGGNCITASIGL
jgi:hypothetical protein